MDAALLSIKFNQTTPTAIPIPIYPVKTVIPLAACVVLLIVIQQFVQDVKTVIKGSKE